MQACICGDIKTEKAINYQLLAIDTVLVLIISIFLNSHH